MNSKKRFYLFQLEFTLWLAPNWSMLLLGDSAKCFIDRFLSMPFGNILYPREKLDILTEAVVSVVRLVVLKSAQFEFCWLK